MSDRAANMKAFNRQLINHKKSSVGEDASLLSFYTAMSISWLADETEKAVKETETQLTVLFECKFGHVCKFQK